MKKTLFLFGSLLLTFFSSNAQLGSNWDWASTSTVATYSPGRQILDITTDNQQNVYAVGRFMGSITLGGSTIATSGDGTVNFNFDEDAFVIKYNSTGQVQWLQRFGIAKTGSNQVGQVINVDTNGNVYIGGYGMTGNNSNNAFLVKYDANGNLLWSKTDFPLYEVGGINNATDGNIIVQESVGGSKNIYKIDALTGTTIWTVANTGAGSNAGTTFQDFVDDAGNVYYTCFGSGAVTIAGQSFPTTQVTTFIVSLDTNGVKRWVQPIDNVQVQLSYTIDNDGKSYIQIGGGIGGTFQGVSTASYGGNRYLVLDNNGLLVRHLSQSPYKGLFRVKNDAIYGYVLEGGGYNGTLNYGSFSFPVPLDNKIGLGIVIKYDKTNDAVIWANSFSFIGDSAFSVGKLLTIETTTNNKILVGGQYNATVAFGSGTYTINSYSGSYPRDWFLAQGTMPSLASETFLTEKMDVFPNPANTIIHIKGIQNGEVRIFSLLGQSVLQQKIQDESAIDISSLRPGTYIVDAVNDNGKSMKTKLIKI